MTEQPGGSPKRRSAPGCFRGGATTTLTLPRPLTAQQLRVTHDEVRRQIDTLLDEYTDAQVANVLNERGLRTGAGRNSLRNRFGSTSAMGGCR